ncbi:MAG TPA: zinc ribbon domain-containing protein [Gemmatimonadaceae bacterium]|jgi:putative FmdB family regulatory protein|nr:zinc ribbon domain-containing protein [Gemmatimonadaceae bacterium]
MPTYEYQCHACQATFSVRESISQHGRADVACPQCHSRDVELRMSEFYAKTPRKS